MTAPAYPSAPPVSGYPIALDVDGPAPQSRLTVLFRIILVIPHQIIMYFLNIAAQVIALIAWFAILFTGRFPAGMFGFVAGYMQWTARVNGYMFLLTGAYPPFSLDPLPSYPVRLDVPPAIEGRNRVTVLLRIFMVIPHLIVLTVIGIAAAFVLIVAWFAALFTAKVPEGLHNFLAGTLRWSTRANAYLFLLTDEYPPFSLS